MAFAHIVTRLAAAAPFLLLSTCRSLHVMEDDHVLQVIFGVHHKTGTELLNGASKCFDSSFKYTVDSHWKGDPLGPHEKAVHLIRNPTSLALSAYLYHKETGEDWSFEPGWTWQKFGKDPIIRKFIVNRSEPYTDFLRRVDTYVGLRAELTRLTGGELNEIENAAKSCTASSRCIQMCLEDFTTSSSSYGASWREVLSFLGKNLTAHMRKCLVESDLNKNPPSANDHVTSNILSEAKYNQLRDLVARLDVQAFNGRLKKMAKGQFDCGASKFLLEAQTGPNAIDGGEYRGWLATEEFS